MENSKKEEVVSDLRMFRVPNKFLNFVRRNPRAAEKIGQGMYCFEELEKKGYKIVADIIKVKLLTTTEGIEELLDNGTKEEFLEFAAHVFSVKGDDIIAVDDITPDFVDEFKDRLKREGITTVVTTCENPIMN